jgi:hypothetical protein
MMAAAIRRGFEGHGWLIVAIILAFGAAVPLLNLLLSPGHPLYPSSYMMVVFGRYLTLMLLALSVGLVWGYCGILSLGHGAFFALGGYAMGMYLMRQIGTRGVYGHPVLPGEWRLHPIPFSGSGGRKLQERGEAAIDGPQQRQEIFSIFLDLVLAGLHGLRAGGGVEPEHVIEFKHRRIDGFRITAGTIRILDADSLRPQRRNESDSTLTPATAVAIDAGVGGTAVEEPSVLLNEHLPAVVTKGLEIAVEVGDGDPRTRAVLRQRIGGWSGLGHGRSARRKARLAR